MFKIILMATIALTPADVVRQIRNTECDCLARRDGQILTLFGAGSVEAEKFRYHVVETCRVTLAVQYTTCSEDFL